MLKCHSLKSPWLPIAPPSCSWPLGRAEVDGNGSKLFPIPKNLGFSTRNQSSARSEPKFKFHSLKSSLVSYSPSILFFTSRLSWGSWKWSQRISHSHKPWVLHQKQISSMFRTKVKVSLLEVILGLLQPLHPVLDLQVKLRLMKRIPKSQMICHAKKILGLTPQASL